MPDVFPLIEGETKIIIPRKMAKGQLLAPTLWGVFLSRDNKGNLRVNLPAGIQFLGYGEMGLYAFTELHFNLVKDALKLSEDKELAVNCYSALVNKQLVLEALKEIDVNLWLKLKN